MDCSDPEGTPGKWLDRAKGGKLYLSAIDGLSPPLQQALPRHFPSRLALWPPTGMQRRPRIIALTTRDLPQLVPNRVIQFHGIGMAYMQQDGATCLFPVGPNEEAIVRLDPTGAITLAHFEGGATGFLNGSDLSDRPGESKAATGRAPTRTRAASREPAKDSPQERTEGRQMSARAHDNPKPQARHSKVIEQAMEAASAAMKDAGKAYAAAGLDRSARFSPAERPCTRWASSPKPR